MPDIANREFAYTRSDFDHICRLVYEHAGIVLKSGKEDMIYGRLSRRIRKLNMSSFKQYVELLQSNSNNSELGNFINAVTTNLTAFFREKHHFDMMKETILPDLMSRNKASRRIRIWSAGCSTGEEPYSIAMTVAETMPSGWDVKILATDLDTNVLAHCEQGIYDNSRIEGLDKRVVQRWFQRNGRDDSGHVRIQPELQEMISFRQLNLLGDWPMRGPLDIIFCRNVIIYFDMQTKQTLVNRYAGLLGPERYLFLGHSEAMNKMSACFELRGKSVYIRNDN